MNCSPNKCVIYKSLVDGRTKTIDFVDKLSGDEVYEEIAIREGINRKVFRVLENGKPVKHDTIIQEKVSFLSLFIPMCGGKGGFGSMLRAIGAQIEKTTNKEACRDLSGRRLRDINAEKRIKEWISKQATRKEEEERKKKERLEKLKEEPKIEFKDDEYFKNRQEIPEVVETAIEYGLKLESSTTKASTDTQTKKKSVKETGRLWIGVDIDDEDDDDSECDSKEGSMERQKKENNECVESSVEPSTSKRSLEDDNEVTFKKLCTA